MGRVKVDAFKCDRCGHVWLPRNIEQEPTVCPNAKAPTGTDHAKPTKREDVNDKTATKKR
jgi:Zn-finger nucleic acid-binding protein